jgi:transcriptional regulator with XRE-family HTH domain
MGFKERFIELQNDAGYTNYRLAKLLRTSKSTITNYRTGATIPTSSMLDHIAVFFGVNSEWLEFGKGEKAAKITPDLIEEASEIYDCRNCKKKDELIETLRRTIDRLNKVLEKSEDEMESIKKKGFKPFDDKIVKPNAG